MEPLCSRQYNVRQLTPHQRERNKAVFERAAESAVQRLLETTDASRLSDFALLYDWEDVFPLDKLPSFSVRALLLLDVILTSPHFDLCQRSKPGFSSAVLSSQRRTLKGGNRWLSVALSLCNVRSILHLPFLGCRTHSLAGWMTEGRLARSECDQTDPLQSRMLDYSTCAYAPFTSQATMASRLRLRCLF